jgi:hypothetical protein
VEAWTLSSLPSGQPYYELLRVALDYTTEFRFVTYDKHRATEATRDLMFSLQPWFIGSVQSNEWPGTRHLGGELPRLSKYRYEAGSLAAIRKRTHALADWGSYLPVDPHLLRADESVWMASTTSEEDAWLTLTEDEHREVMSNRLISTLLPDAADS